MKRDTLALDHLHGRLQCFGEFNVQDAVCRQVCALRLRCAVEYGRQERMERLEDLFSEDEVHERLH